MCAAQVDMGLAEDVKREIKARLDEHMKANANDFVGEATVFIDKLERHGLKATLEIYFTMNHAGDDFERLQKTGDAAYQVISDVVGRRKRGGDVQHTTTCSVRLVGDSQIAAASATT
mmetsp:Transcript_30785/g.79077  ORF Transcript_30785/g.79077 Transcript_30785/m.79077 type:complete len:117 (+) Transcript_30785:1-351(+)